MSKEINLCMTTGEGIEILIETLYRKLGERVVVSLTIDNDGLPELMVDSVKPDRVIRTGLEEDTCKIG